MKLYDGCKVRVSFRVFIVGNIQGSRERVNATYAMVAIVG
jgi:hypothetical protein